MKKKQQKVKAHKAKKHFLLRNVGIVSLLVAAGLTGITYLSYTNFLDKKNADEIISLNQNAVYVISTDKPDGAQEANGYYYLYPIEIRNQIGKTVPDKSNPIYIAAAPGSLEPFINKNVKVTGKVVWTESLLNQPGTNKEQPEEKTAGAVIDSIESVN